MQDQVRKQLKTLCLNILQEDDLQNLDSHIERCQQLLEQLYIARHLQTASSTEEKQAPPSSAEKMQLTEDKVQFVEKKNDKPTEVEEQTGEIVSKGDNPPYPSENAPIDEPINEGPVDLTESPANQDLPTEAKPLTEDKVQFVEKTEENSDTKHSEPQTSLGLDDFVPAKPKGAPKGSSLNQRLAQGSINFGLNDRIAFVKNLFSDDMSDFNRVVSQLNTFEDFEEAENFIEQMIKPEYDWSQKEEYELRFMNVVRQRFGLDEKSDE